MRRTKAGYVQQGSGKARLLVAIIIAFGSFLVYWTNTSKNPLTGESQRVAGITLQDEIQLGLQARDQMAQEFGGYEQDPAAIAKVDRIGRELIQKSIARNSDWQFEFHVLRDPRVINAFALPGGQVFVTEGLLHRLDTDGQVAGVLGHEMGHVIERHGAQHMAKEKLSQGVTVAAVVASGDYRTGRLAQIISGLVNLKYGRNDELEADRWGVKLSSEAGYDPRAMIRVMEILKAAVGGKSQPEFFSTHPNPDNRIEKIKAEIDRLFPQGVPTGLRQ